MYGNYDGNNSANPGTPLSFDLHLGIDLWSKIQITNASAILMAEVLTVAANSFLSACLVNTGNGIPFISALELRHLSDSIYPNLNRDQSLIVGTRYDFGSLTNRILRFPDDPYDRMWLPYVFAPSTWTTINTTLSIVDVSRRKEFEAPSAVLRTAATPKNGTTMYFVLFTDSVYEQFYYALYFAELQNLTGNSKRLFDISISGDSGSYYNPLYLQLLCIYNAKPYNGRSQYEYLLSASDNSSLPPLINALETYYGLTHTGNTTDSVDVSAINSIKAQYQLKQNWMGDPCLPLDFVWEGLTCTYVPAGSYKITSINLSSTGLTGALSPSFANLTALKYLDLSYNKLTGPIPEVLGNLQSLELLDLSCNNLSGHVPAALLEKLNQGKLTLRTKNGASSSCERVTMHPSRQKITTPVIVIISVVAAVLLITLATFTVWRIIKRSDNIGQNPKHAGHPIQLEIREFTYKQLVHISQNFGSRIGRGGFGSVYLDVLESGKQVAIKLLSQSSSQGTKEFLAEAQNLTRIHHRNLVSFIGYCMDKRSLGLVYEYMAQGNLHDHLKGKIGNRTLPWTDRLRIAVEAAQGLEYLHRGCKPPIIHRAIKTSNILLGEDLEAKIADFGLSKAFQNEKHTHVSATAVVGTPGYLDPEYHTSMQLYEKSDVYSFGVVLIELVTGQPPIMVRGTENVHIVQWAIQRLEMGHIDDIVDERLNGEYDVNSVWRVLDIAMKCTAPKGSPRPPMPDVVMQLKETFELVISVGGQDRSHYAQSSDDSGLLTASEIGGNMSEPFVPAAR